jgi:RNA-directed DNA polymerase
LDRRKHSYCGYADDCNIYVGSQAAAERTLASVQAWIEKHLRLKVNAAKSGTGSSGTSTQLREDWNRYVRGWWGYYRLAEARGPLIELEKWVRRHIRKCFWLRWHDRKGRERDLRRLGITGKALGVATSRRGAWRVAAQPELHQG